MTSMANLLFGASILLILLFWMTCDTSRQTRVRLILIAGMAWIVGFACIPDGFIYLLVWTALVAVCGYIYITSYQEGKDTSSETEDTSDKPLPKWTSTKSQWSSASQSASAMAPRCDEDAERVEEMKGTFVKTEPNACSDKAVPEEKTEVAQQQGVEVLVMKNTDFGAAQRKDDSENRQIHGAKPEENPEVTQRQGEETPGVRKVGVWAAQRRDDNENRQIHGAKPEENPEVTQRQGEETTGVRKVGVWAAQRKDDNENWQMPNTRSMK